MESGGTLTGRDGATRRGASRTLAAYCDDIRPEPLLTAAEERALSRAARRGDADAADRLVRANLRLVITIAKGFRGRGLDLDDLVGEGNLGLIRAVEEFDPGFGVRFSTYAAYWIREAIRHALINTTPPIRLPAYMVTLLGRWRDAERAHLIRHGHPPTPGQVAESLGLTDERRAMVEAALMAGRFLPVGSEEQADALEQAESPPGAQPGDEIDGEERRRELRRRVADRLDDRERMIVLRHAGLDGGRALSHREIARELGITREWVRKLEHRAIGKLSSPN